MNSKRKRKEKEAELAANFEGVDETLVGKLKNAYKFLIKYLDVLFSLKAFIDRFRQTNSASS